jgi:hypothetical protein
MRSLRMGTGSVSGSGMFLLSADNSVLWSMYMHKTTYSATIPVHGNAFGHSCNIPAALLIHILLCNLQWNPHRRRILIIPTSVHHCTDLAILFPPFHIVSSLVSCCTPSHPSLFNKILACSMPQGSFHEGFFPGEGGGTTIRRKKTRNDCVMQRWAKVTTLRDIKSVNNIFGSPVTSWKEVGRVDCCMKCEKS